MASSSNHHQPPSTTTVKTQTPPPSTSDNTLFPPHHDDDDDDPTLNLTTSTHLTTEQLLRRRLTRTRKLTGVYRHHFWALMEDLRVKYRHYYWKYGLSPFSNTHHVDNNAFGPEDCGETSNAAAAAAAAAADNGGGEEEEEEGGRKLGLGFGESVVKRCGYSGCKFKAMALTSFCHMHILSDPNQLLYKPCNFVIKNTEQGQILCEKPILSSAAPSLCASHLPKILNDVKQGLKKAGLTASSSGRLAPKFHVVVAEYVKLIQSRRREARKHNKKNIVIKDESKS